VIPFKTERYCPDCIDKVGGGTGSVPWESQRATLGFLGAYWATLKAVLLSPSAFYQSMPTDAGLGAPLGYHVLFGWVFGAIAALEQLALNVALIGTLSTILKTPGGGSVPFGPENAIGPIFQIMVLPVALVIDAFVGGAFDHVVALLCGGTGSYEATVRLRCYAAGSAAPLSIIPIGGPIATWIWKWICQYHGFVHAHRLSSGKALLCVVWPLILGVVCCCSGLGLAFILGAAGGAGGGGGGGF
jgi:hypothetical protein